MYESYIHTFPDLYVWQVKVKVKFSVCVSHILTCVCNFFL